MSPKLKLNDETTYQLSLGGNGKTGEGRIPNKLVGMFFVFLAITPLTELSVDLPKNTEFTLYLMFTPKYRVNTEQTKIKSKIKKK